VRALAPAWLVLIPLCGSCGPPAAADPDALVVGITSGPNSFDPRFGLDDVSQKVQALLYDPLVTHDAHLRIAPRLATDLVQSDPTAYLAVLRPGVSFHDGHELTSADVVHTFRTVLTPDLASPRRGAFWVLRAVTAVDRYRVRFELSAPHTAFPYELAAMPIIPDGAGPDLNDRPIGTGPYRFVRYAVDDQVQLAAHAAHWRGAPRNSGLVLKVVPDEVMRALEVRKGSMDILVNDVSPDLFFQLAGRPSLQTATAPGVDYQYIGLKLTDPILRDVRVRRALAYAVDRSAIVKHLRRDLALPARGLLPPISWAYEPGTMAFEHDPDRARTLLDEAGWPDPDGAGPRHRFSLSLKVSNLEFNRLQASVIQEGFRRIGVGLDVRTYEFATLFADVQAGHFQLYTLQWTAGALADPDILRRIFHTSQTPPAGFNRGRYSNAEVDRLLEQAAASADDADRRMLYGEAQRLLAADVPYISLWHKTNFIVAQQTLSGLQLTPLADFDFLRNVSRTRTSAAND
jgi:peptide/nickel transport system substrate-binding protein